MQKACKDCAAAFQAPEDPVLCRFTVFCPDCYRKNEEKWKTEEAARIAAERETRWAAICPPAYLLTERSKLPHPTKADEVLSWNYGPTGLILHGKTRRGKTRCAWLLVRKVFETGKSVRVLDSMSGFQYGGAFANSGRDAQDWIDSRARAGLLFLDDVFKVKLTDSFECAVFAIVEYRLSHQLPIVATLNDTGETLASRMSSDRGDAFVARLREMCQIIQF
ncbi:MAG: hypothetical protein KGJ13_06835 [Patescibacteria group bacterium]|nr:hypothetical protein [Patescibacteria group bacterium]